MKTDMRDLWIKAETLAKRHGGYLQSVHRVWVVRWDGSRKATGWDALVVLPDENVIGGGAFPGTALRDVIRQLERHAATSPMARA